LFERVAVKVLRTRFPELRITGPSGDLNRDAFGRPLFGEHDKIVLLVSCEDRWTVKLKRDLGEYAPYPADARPAKAIFVTNQSTKQTTQQRYKEWSRDALGIGLEVVDLNELALELESDALHRVAEYDLGVRPRSPRILQPVAVFRERQESLLPGADVPFVGRDREMRMLRDALTQAHEPGGARIAVVEGPAGVGKTRLAIDASHATATTLVAAPGTAVPVDSLADLWHDAVDTELIAQVFAVIAVAEQHTFQVLTKRPGRMHSLLADPGFWAQVEEAAIEYDPSLEARKAIECQRLSNLWLGVSVETQKWAPIRLDKLAATRAAAVRFVSCEPLLGELDLRPWLTSGLDWVIAGGESGPRARPMHPQWAFSLRDQCLAADVPYFFKQWGAFAPEDHGHDRGKVSVIDTRGHAWEGMVNPAPAEAVQMRRVGKGRAGRLLDGKTWSQFPATAITAV
jgi:protein gp37